jgi:DnaK suppressor protein
VAKAIKKVTAKPSKPSSGAVPARVSGGKPVSTKPAPKAVPPKSAASKSPAAKAVAPKAAAQKTVAQKSVKSTAAIMPAGKAGTPSSKAGTPSSKAAPVVKAPLPVKAVAVKPAAAAAGKVAPAAGKVAVASAKPVVPVPGKPATPPAKPEVAVAKPVAAVTKPVAGVAAKAAAPVGKAAAPVGKAAAPGKPGVAVKGGKAGKNQPPAKLVISAKPGQILMTPLKPTGNKPPEPVAPKTPAEEKADKDRDKAARLAKIRPPVAPPPLPPAPVTTDSKAKKNQAGLAMKELEFFRELLLTRRRELLGVMSFNEREALRGGGATLSNLPVHMADMGSDNYEQEFTLTLVEKERQELREINLALAKIQNGTYGICEGTGKPIAKARLEAQPWTRYSIDHARALEKPSYRRPG